MRNATKLAALIAAGLFTPASADAFTLHRTPDGLAVRWSVPSVTYVVDASLDAISPGATEVARRSFEAWTQVAGAAAPSVSIEKGVADGIGYRIGDDNQNTIRYMPGGSELAGGALAITVLTFDSSGALLDADIIVNGAPGRAFAVLTTADQAAEDTAYVFDLEEVLTHEAGHSFGMAHNNDDDAAAMYPVIDPGEHDKRALSADDEDGLRLLYPEDSELAPAASCAVGVGTPRSDRGIAAAGVALGLAAARRMRRHVPRWWPAAVVVGLTLLSFGASTRVASASPAAETKSELIAHVVAAEPRWVDGLVVTRLTLSTPSGLTTVDTLGGAIDGVTQVVGDRVVPKVGAGVPMRWRAQDLAHESGLPVSPAASLVVE